MEALTELRSSLEKGIEERKEIRENLKNKGFYKKWEKE